VATQVFVDEAQFTSNGNIIDKNADTDIPFTPMQ
jgi:hypothetical protein